MTELEQNKVFPPRFKIHYIRNDPLRKLHSKISVFKNSKDEESVIGYFPFIKEAEGKHYYDII